jgi:hypothetical protein
MPKHSIFKFVCILLLCATPAFAASPDDLGEQAPLFKQALSYLRLDADEFKFDMQDFQFYNQDKYRPFLLDVYYNDPWKISPYTRMQTQQMLDTAGSLSNTMVKAQTLTGHPVRNNIPGYDALSTYQPKLEEHGADALAVALAELTGEPADHFRTPDYDALPASVRDSAALYCFTAKEALDLRQVAVVDVLHKLGYGDLDAVYSRLMEWAIDEPMEEPNTRYTRSEAVFFEELLDNIDFDRLNAGAMLMASCLETITTQLQATDDLSGSYRYVAETPYGRMIISRGTNDHYSADVPYLLILDLSGDDTYANAAATISAANPLSCALDLAGDDRYEAPLHGPYNLAPHYDKEYAGYTGEHYTISRLPSFGAGVMGYGLLIDAAGDDYYDCQFNGQGCGIFGVGALQDLGGDDSYHGIGNLQGSGTAGTGLLIDNGGNDHYECYVYSQGFGYTCSVGVLLDAGDGQDEYIANNTDIVYDGPHSPIINLNLSQGFGYGRRDDMTEGHSWMGGVGVLVDGGGDDNYDCGIYALGGGYWGAVGILADKGGNDHYMSAHYCLAAPPHYSLGIFQDDAGNDVYYGYLRQAIGHGRDWSLGWFEDSAGDDWYQGGHMSLGQGDVNSIGVFWDKGGNDTYLLCGPGFGMTTTAGDTTPRTGAPGSIRWFQLCVGLFIDGGGDDKYLQVPEELPFTGDISTLKPDANARNNAVWINGDSINAPMGRSVGIDAAG